MASWLSGVKTFVDLFSLGFSISNQYKSNKISEEYYEAQMDSTAESLNISKESLKLQYENLRNSYEQTLNDFRTNRLSVMQQRDSYAASKDQTELTIENLIKGQGGIEYYNALLSRWQDDYDYQVATTRREGKAAYDSLMANYTGTEVMHAEAGRSGKTAELLEQQRKQDVEAFVGKDMKLDAIGGIYSQTLTELTKDLSSDKHTYMTQLGILGKSLVQERENLKDYRTNLAEIDNEISKYDAQIKAYEDILSGESSAFDQDIEGAMSGLQPGEDETPETTETTTPDPVTEDTEQNNRIMDSIVNGDDSAAPEVDHVGTSTKDWSDYSLKHNDISSNLAFIKANPDKVTLEVLDASNLGNGWTAFRATDESGKVVEIYRDADGRMIQYGTDEKGNKTYRLVTDDGDWKTYKADDLESAIKELDKLDELGDLAHGGVALGAGLLGGPVGIGIGLVDAIYSGVAWLDNKSRQSSYDAVYKAAQQQAAQQLIDQYSDNWYNEQTEEEVRQAAEEAGSPTYMYDGQKYDTDTGEAHEETPAIQQGLDSGEYKYDSTGAVVGGESTEQPGPRTSGGGTGGSYSSLEERVAAEQAQVEWQPTVEERVEANIEADKTSNRVNEMIDQSSANLYGSPEEPKEESAPAIQTAPGSQTEPRPRTSGGGTGGSYSSLEERVAAEQAEIEKAKAEAEAAAKAEEEARAAKEKAEAEAKAQAEAEAKAKAEAEAQAKAEAEAKAAAEKAQREAEEAAKAAEEARIKAEKEAEEARKAEEQRQAEEAERAKEEARKKAKEAEEAKAKAEAEAKAAAEAQAKAEAEAKAAAEAQAKAEAEAEAAKKAQEETAQRLLSKFSSLFSRFFGVSSSSSSQTQPEPEPEPEPKPRTTGGGTGGSYSSLEDRVEKEQAQVEASKTSSSSSSSSSSSGSSKTNSSSSSSSSYSPAIQEGLDSGKYKVDENGYVVAAGSSSTPRARR